MFDVTLNEGGGTAKILLLFIDDVLLLLLLNRSATDDDDNDDDGGLISVEDLMMGFGFAVVENEDASAEVEEPNRSEAAVNDVGLIGSLVSIFLEFASLNKS